MRKPTGPGGNVNPGGPDKKVPLPARHPHKTKTKRKLALSGAVDCCAAEAVAASLRMTGREVNRTQVLDLYRRVTNDDSEGATIEATLEAAVEHGVAGVKPVSYSPTTLLKPGVVIGLTFLGIGHAITVADFTESDVSTWGRAWSWGELVQAELEMDELTEEAWRIDWPLVTKEGSA